MAANDGEHPITDSGIPGVTYPMGTGAQGSTGGMPHGPSDGGVAGTAQLSPVYESVQGGVQHLAQGTLASQASGNVDQDGISGVDASPKWMSGRVIAPRGPGSGQG